MKPHPDLLSLPIIRGQQRPAQPSATRIIDREEEPERINDDPPAEAITAVATKEASTMSVDAQPPEDQSTRPVSLNTIPATDSSSLHPESASSSSTGCQSSLIEQQVYMPATLAAAVIPPIHHYRMMGKYKLLGTLGTGITGRVKKAQNIRDGTFAGLKILYKHQRSRTRHMIINIMRSTKEASDVTMLQVEAEVKALQLLDHPHIIKLREVDYQAMYPKSNGQEVPSIVLALELAEQGELFDHISKAGHFSEVVARTIFKQLLSAIQYCHSRGIYHRDIKPENLLFDNHFQLKLADFGLCDIENDQSEGKIHICGTRAYMAPEVLRCEAHDGAKADSWSMGAVLFAFLTGYLPFEYAGQGDWWYSTICKNNHARFWKSHLAYSPHVSSQAQVLLSAIFQCNPRKRLSPDQMMAHKWMQGSCLSDEDLFTAMSDRLSIIVNEEKE